MTDWAAWHGDYEVPSSSLARRLTVVRARLTDILGGSVTAPRKVLDLCAGDGRDLLPVLSSLPPERRPTAVLVDLDPGLARAASSTAAAAGLDESVTVIEADAGRPETFAHALPVDLLMLCGIFGNVSETDIQTTVAAAATMLTEDGIVIWTRGAGHPGPDLRPTVRGWFRDAGFTELSWDGDPEKFGVGVCRRAAQAPPRPLPPVLFRFTAEG